MSSADHPDRATLLATLQTELIQTIADGVLLQQAAADRLGLSLSDFKCLTALGETGQSTAGDLATRTGLTTGAVTRMIDRLEHAGWVRRHHDRQDRRRVIIQPIPERLAEVGPLFQGMAAAWAKALADYDDDQIRMTLELFQRMRAVARQQAALLKAGK